MQAIGNIEKHHFQLNLKYLLVIFSQFSANDDIYFQKKERRMAVAKIYKRKKKTKKSNMIGKSFAILFLSISIYLCTHIFVRQYNNGLSQQIQKCENEIAALKVDNDAVKVAIMELQSKDRVISIAADSGLSYNHENIITITKD